MKSPPPSLFFFFCPSAHPKFSPIGGGCGKSSGTPQLTQTHSFHLEAGAGNFRGRVRSQTDVETLLSFCPIEASARTKQSILARMSVCHMYSTALRLYSGKGKITPMIRPPFPHLSNFNHCRAGGRAYPLRARCAVIPA